MDSAQGEGVIVAWLSSAILLLAAMFYACNNVHGVLVVCVEGCR